MNSNPFQSLVSLLSNILEAYTTAFFILDAKSRELKLTASQSLSKFLPNQVTLPLEQSGILAQVQKVGQTIHIDKLPEVSSSLSATVPFYRDGESHIKGLFAIPVADGAGVLYADTKYGWGFNDKQQKWIREIAEVLGELLTKQESLSSTDSYAQMVDLWKRLDIVSTQGYTLNDYCQLVVNECSKFLDAEYGFIAIREPAEQSYQLLASTQNAPRALTSPRYLIKQGLIGWIFQNRKPLLISRLNPQTQEHFLFSPSEGLPHHGTLWGIPAQMSLGHTLVLSFLSRNSMEWSAEYQQAIAHVLHFFQLLLEQFYLKDECEHLQVYDLATGLLNPLSFEASVDSLLASSMQTSTPFTLALVQFEPWQLLSTKASPKQVRQWQVELSHKLCEVLPADVTVGQISENRYSILFAGLSAQDARHHLSHLSGLGQQVLKGKIKGVRLLAYMGAVSFPQDGTRSEELWPAVSQRLFSTFRSKSEHVSTQN